LFLLIIDKRLFFSFIKYFVILFLIFFGFFLFIFGNDFSYQTIFTMKILPIKSLSFSIPLVTLFLIKFLPFCLLNFVLAIIFFKKSNTLKVFYFLFPVFGFHRLFLIFLKGHIFTFFIQLNYFCLWDLVF